MLVCEVVCVSVCFSDHVTELVIICIITVVRWHKDVQHYTYDESVGISFMKQMITEK